KNESWNSETSTSLPLLQLQGGHRQGGPVRGGQWIVIVGRYGIGLSAVLRQRRAVGDALRGLGRQHQELDAAIGRVAGFGASERDAIGHARHGEQFAAVEPTGDQLAARRVGTRGG